MASTIGICNLALSRIGARSIQALTESTQEARQCNIIYETVRDAVLSDNKWDFATKRLTLALLTDTYSGWTYAYAYPTDCLVADEIYDEYGNYSGVIYDTDTNQYVQTGKVEFEVAVNEDLNSRIILTDKEDAELIYTAKITNPNLFSSQFSDAFAWRLAADLCIPLKGNAQLQRLLMQQYDYLMGIAKANNANEGHKKPGQDNPYVDCRR